MKKLGIAGQVAIFFAVITILLLTGITLGNVSLYGRRIESSLMETMNAVAENNAQQLEKLMGRVQLLADNLTIADSTVLNRRNRYLSFFLEKQGNTVESLSNYFEINSAFQSEVQNALSSIVSPYTASLIVSPDMPLSNEKYLPWIVNDQLIFRPGKNSIVVHSKSFSESEWYRAALEGEGVPYWFLHGETVCVARSLTVLAEEKMNIYRQYDLGVLLVCFSPDWFAENLISEKLTPNTRVAVSSQDDVLLWSNLDTVPEDAYELHQNPSSQLRMSTWIPWADIYAITSNPLSVSLAILIFSLALGGVLVFLASVYVSRPIRTLSDFMLHHKGETIPADKMPLREDEIGVLYRSYNEQLITIRKQEEEKKRMSIARLQAQINPHFLYNTLDSLCFLAMAEGSDQIADSLAALARIFRYNTKNADGETNLRDELEILDLYMSIYRLKSADTVEYQVDCPEELRARAVIPKMIIQPLVENALLYGAADGQCRIRIVCRAVSGELHITVSDGGGKADPALLNAYLNGERDMPHHSTGLGVRNVHQRIFMRYGAGYGLSYAKSEIGETVARLRLPLHFRPEEG